MRTLTHDPEAEMVTVGAGKMFRESTVLGGKDLFTNLLVSYLRPLPSPLMRSIMETPSKARDTRDDR
jgi:hypothetical protein